MSRAELKRWFAVCALATLLSAILAPLVAQSRPSPDDLCFARMRTVGTALQMYLQDYDENFPLAFGRSGTGTWLWNRYHSVPYD